MSRQKTGKQRREKQPKIAVPPLAIKYPWSRGGGPTPEVLWICPTCGEAFWAAEMAIRSNVGRLQYSCSNHACPKKDALNWVRRATAEETTEAEKHLKVDSKGK